MECGGLTYVTLRDAGHFLAISQPRLALKIFKTFCQDSLHDTVD